MCALRRGSPLARPDGYSTRRASTSIRRGLAGQCFPSSPSSLVSTSPTPDRRSHHLDPACHRTHGDRLAPYIGRHRGTRTGTDVGAALPAIRPGRAFGALLATAAAIVDEPHAPHGTIDVQRCAFVGGGDRVLAPVLPLWIAGAVCTRPPWFSSRTRALVASIRGGEPNTFGVAPARVAAARAAVGSGAPHLGVLRTGTDILASAGVAVLE